MIMSVVTEGYKIPFIEFPPPMFYRNNNSSLNEISFVTDSILELLTSNRISEKPDPSYTVSPLSVAFQPSGKKRLILDLRRINKFVQKNHFKIDDWKVALQFFSENAQLISFDLKSGYHHKDIANAYQKYLGFSRTINGVQRYFEFTVLPFGLSSAPLIFTKVLKPLVTHWRAFGIVIALYLDDGFIVIPKLTNNTEIDATEAKKISKHVRVDLLRAGFIYNIAKSIWEPSESIEWLGMRWDTREGTLRVLDRRISTFVKFKKRTT